MKEMDEDGRGSLSLVREQMKSIIEPSDLDKNRQMATQVHSCFFVTIQPENCVLLTRTWNSGVRLLKSIAAKVKGLKTSDTIQRDKEAVQVFMKVKAKEEIVSRQLSTIRHLVDGELDEGWCILSITFSPNCF